jgi:hypothetical protein
MYSYTPVGNTGSPDTLGVNEHKNPFENMKRGQRERFITFHHLYFQNWNI